MTEATRANIDEVWHDHLCTQCGACWGVCPKDNIRIGRAADRDYVFRVVDSDHCRSCGLCVRVCPGVEVDFAQLRESLFRGHEGDPWFGHVSAAYLTRSTDPEAARRGASGGTATALLAFGLTTGRIDGALVLGSGRAVPWEPRPFVARTTEELHAATGSKYCPAPTCMSFREVLATPGRYALVGLPCHIHALRKAQDIFPKLRERVVLVVGLFCGPGPSFLMVDHLLARRGARLADLRRLRFRDKHAHGEVWPGGMVAELRDGREILIPLEKYLYAQTLFTRRRCHVCPDYAAEFADLSMGDAHLREFWTPPLTYRSPSGRVVHGPDGWNGLVVRTAAGAEWLEAAGAAGKLDVEALPLDELKEGMAHACYRKKVEFWTRLRVHLLLWRNEPLFPGLRRPKGVSWRHCLIPVLRMAVGEAIHSRLVRWLLTRVPERLLLGKVRWRQRLIHRAADSPEEAHG